MSSLEILKKMKSDKNLIFAAIAYFDLIYVNYQKRRGKIHIRQGLSKVFVSFTYSSVPFIS